MRKKRVKATKDLTKQIVLANREAFEKKAGWYYSRKTKTSHSNTLTFIDPSKDLFRSLKKSWSSRYVG